MKLFKDCWVALLELFNALTLAPTDGSLQQSLQGVGNRPGHGRRPTAPPLPSQTRNPVFSPPSRGESPDSGIICDYSAMGPGWGPCSKPTDRLCWLEGPNGQRFDVSTDYETRAPKGVLRKYYIEAVNKTINADGIPMEFGKVWNHTYPGPWIQACWGDEIEITVKNKLLYNGTTVHWHGIRQLNSFESDGVNAITQCPIATGDHFVYRFKALQYGSTWYHSHYSLQYSDGLLGPLTIHGPSTANYDRPVDPILMTDWNHRSGFQDFQSELTGPPPQMESILLNGVGSYAGVGNGCLKYNVTLKYVGPPFVVFVSEKFTDVRLQGRKYLFRLINTSVDTTFVFSIDNHNLTVITTDFVPIHPYTVDHVVIGIGQRYHVVVEAKAINTDNTLIPNPSAYWIRMRPADGCSSFPTGNIPDEKQGILYYHHDHSIIPRSSRNDFSNACRDEPYNKLVPWIPWTVSFIGNNDDVLAKEPFEVGVEQPQPPKGRPKPNDIFFRWAIGAEPMFLNFSDPTILNLKNKVWAPEKVVIPKDYPVGSWVYLIITGAEPPVRVDPDRQFFRAAHPIHLHGHDFALLQQTNESFTQERFKPKFDNPPRRDVTLLPAGGFIVIAFKSDNPGAWALHCHIAWHASSGLALQILERQEDAQALIVKNPERLGEVTRTCKNWKKWFANPKNFWNPGEGVIAFQDDSGI